MGDLKAQYKTATGREYVAPNSNNSKSAQPKKETKKEMAPVTTPTTSLSPEAEEVVKKIVDQGNKIRDMKSNKAAKDALQPEIDLLLKYKADYKQITGTDYQAPGAGSSKKDKKNKE